MTILVRNKLVVFVCLSSLVFLLSAALLLEGTKRTDFNGDESAWISVGYYYTNLLLKGDLDYERWKCDQCGEWSSWLVSPAGKLMIGFPLKVNPQTADKDFFEFFWWDHTYEWNENAGHIPPPDILLSARSGSALFGALTCVAVFGIGFFAGNFWIGILAVLLLLANQSFFDAATRAMVDIHYDFFLVSLCLPAILLLKQGNNRRRMVLTCCLFGGLAGLAGSVKESGVVVGGLFFVGVVIYKGTVSYLAKKEYIQYLASFSVSALVIVYALNPFYWPTWKQIDVQALAQEVSKLVEEATSGTLVRETFRAEYPQLSNLSHVLHYPSLFIARSRLMDQAIADGYAPWAWDGNRLIVLHKDLLATYTSFPFEWIFIGVGITISMVRTVKSVRNRIGFLQSIPLLYFFATYLVILGFMKVHVFRYYIPTVTAEQILVAMSIDAMMMQAVHIVARLRRPLEAQIKL